MILRIGVGDTIDKQDGYLNVDLRPLPNIDVVADAAKLPFKDNEHDGIESRNLIEHFSRHEIRDVFKEWARVLKPEGVLAVETVDVGELMNNWKNIPTENWLDGLLGAQTYPENFHKMAFTKELLLDLLYEAGLYEIQVNQFEHRQIPRIQVIAYKA